jgi:CDP-diacylglycerol--glycerol-3-phosphate 3-phosphatidyltransferase
MPPDEQWQSGYRMWLDWTTLAGLFLLLLAAFTPFYAVLLAIIFHGAAGIFLWTLKPHSTTPADRLTLIRGGGIMALYPVALTGAHWGLLLALASLLAAMDLVDGWIARRTGATDFGAVLDMEMDQLMVLALSLIALQIAGLPSWLLLFPGLRYLHLAALRLGRLPRIDPKPKDGDNRRARLICAVVIVVLLSNLIPMGTDLPRLLLNAVALILLIWSFADDFIFIYSRLRQRPQT